LFAGSTILDGLPDADWRWPEPTVLGDEHYRVLIFGDES
jgi:hypothetical protein